MQPAAQQFRPLGWQESSWPVQESFGAVKVGRDRCFLQRSSAQLVLEAAKFRTELVDGVPPTVSNCAFSRSGGLAASPSARSRSCRDGGVRSSQCRPAYGADSCWRNVSLLTSGCLPDLRAGR